MKEGKHIYFASDFHLGLEEDNNNHLREKKIIAWMNSIKNNCEELFLVGDLFDVWFEYKRVVPKGAVRLLAKIAEFSDAGIPVHVFTGNHDMWMFGYLEKECGVTLHRKCTTREFNGKKIFIGHGDGLGPGDKGYKLIKKIFASKFCQWFYARLHPNFGIWLATYFSRKGYRKKHNENNYKGDEKEFLVQYVTAELKKGNKADFFIFGHRHLPIDKLIEKARYINLGDWISFNTYAVFDGNSLELKSFI